MVELFKDDYATFVGIWLNRSRMINRQSMSVNAGVAVGMKPMLGAKIPDQYFEDIAETKDQSILFRDLIQPENS